MRSTSSLNEPQNIDLTTEKENRNLRSRIINRAVPSECRTFTRGTEISERKIRPPQGATRRLK
jgi:hypothetical protein